MKNTNKMIISVAVAAIAAAAGFFMGKEASMSAENPINPQFAQTWNHFIEHDVKPHGNLDAATRYLVIMAAHIANQSVNEYKIILSEALNNGVTPVAAQEVIYQAIPYVGMAKVYDFFAAANQVFVEHGIKLPLPDQSTTTPNNRLEKGLAAQKAIFGSHIDEMRANAPDELKHIQDYLSANCFGDYYTRTGLDLKTRELLTFALISSLGGADPQVRAHVQGNLNIGNNKQVLLDVVSQILPYIGYPRSLNAIAAVNDIAKE